MDFAAPKAVGALAENTESCLSRLVLRHAGHSGTIEPRTRTSKPLRHSLQTYSYIGIALLPPDAKYSAGSRGRPPSMNAESVKCPAVKSISFHGRQPVINGGTDVLDGSPGTVEVLKDVVFMPDRGCLFTRDGFAIPETALHRGLEERKEPGRVELPRRIARADGPVIFLGTFLFGHWGHFLTEGISRLWGLHDKPELAALPKLSLRRRENAPFIGNFLSYAGIGPGPLIDAREPLHMPEALMPKPSFVIRSHAYSVHGIYPTAVGGHVCAGRKVERSDQPVYLSRRQLPPTLRRIHGEDRLEAMLSAAGARIVSPEKMAFEEQVVLFNSHRTFIGSIGSAFHSILFGPEDGTITTVVLHPPSVRSSYLLIDQVKNVQAHYVNCLQGMLPPVKESPHDLVIDFDVALPVLRQLGIL
jgi:capsular polysaccharide biosynthesis protein